MNRIKNEANGSSRNGDILIFMICILICLVTLYPLYYVLIASVSDPRSVLAGDVTLFPKKFSFEGYYRVFRDGRIMRGLANSFIYGFSGTALNLLITLPAAYVLSRKEFTPRKIVNIFFIFTMFFNGGLIATYITMKNIGLINNWLIFIVGFPLNVYNMIITRTFFENSIPEQLREASVLDGCGDFRYFISIVLPLSKAIIAVIGLYYFVWHWNDYFTGLVYMNKEKFQPLQNVLRTILISNNTGGSLAGDTSFLQIAQQEQIKYASIVVATVPLVVIYPFIQKYFDKGVMIGSVKG